MKNQRLVVCSHLFEKKQVGCCSKWVCKYCNKIWREKSDPPEDMRRVKTWA